MPYELLDSTIGTPTSTLIFLGGAYSIAADELSVLIKTLLLVE